MNLTDATTPRSLGTGDRFELDIEPGWGQGAGVFGGVQLAALTRAMTAGLQDHHRKLRTLTAELVGPIVPGVVQIETKLLREGSSVSTFAASLSQGGRLLAHAVAVFGRARAIAAPNVSTLPPPPASRAPWREVPIAPVAPPLAPEFTPHFEFRVTDGIPFSGASEATAGGWVRARDPGPMRDAAYVVAHADAWWPSSLVVEAAPRLMVTVSFTLELVGDCDGLADDAPLFHNGRCVAGSDGYVVDFRELWGDDGRLVALNQQTIVIVK